MDVGMLVGTASLQQRDRDIRVRGEPVGQRTAGGPGPDNHVIKAILARSTVLHLRFLVPFRSLPAKPRGRLPDAARCPGTPTSLPPKREPVTFRLLPGIIELALTWPPHPGYAGRKPTPGRGASPPRCSCC